MWNTITGSIQLYKDGQKEILDLSFSKQIENSLIFLTLNNNEVNTA